MKRYRKIYFQINYFVYYIARHLGVVYKTHNVYDDVYGNELIRKGILSGKPFMAAKFGSTELHTISYQLLKPFISNKRLDMIISKLCTYSGFFPCDKKYIKNFFYEICNAISNTDLLCNVTTFTEEFMVENYGNDCEKALGYLFPYGLENPWTSALEGKKVLVIHPFVETIQRQYDNNRTRIYENPKMLPNFELYTVKAVQTLADEQDERFATWFEALDYMFEEAMKIDFDVAIIGCGAYGMPLAGRIKSAGKSAIHMGGGLQLLFGIKGSRWDESNDFYNEYWVRPSELERIKSAEKIEGACYW